VTFAYVTIKTTRSFVSQMEREGIEFREVDIDQDPAAADLVMSLNGGNATVPTIVLADGRTLTNPPLPELLSALRAA
jgi:mycoredoxin